MCRVLQGAPTRASRVEGQTWNGKLESMEMGHTFFTCSTAPPWTWAWAATWWGMEVPWCLGQPGVGCLRKNEKDQNMPQGPLLFFWIGACRRREKGLIRVGRDHGEQWGHGESLESILSGGIASPPRPSSQNPMENLGVLDRRHPAMWTRTGVPAVQCRLCCAAFATLFLPESICVPLC